MTVQSQRTDTGVGQPGLEALPVILLTCHTGDTEEKALDLRA